MKELLIGNVTKITYRFSGKTFARLSLEREKSYTKEKHDYTMSLVDDNEYIYIEYGKGNKANYYNLIDVKTNKRIYSRELDTYYQSWLQHCHNHFITRSEEKLITYGITYTIENLKALYYENGEYVEVKDND